MEKIIQLPKRKNITKIACLDIYPQALHSRYKNKFGLFLEEYFSEKTQTYFDFKQGNQMEGRMQIFPMSSCENRAPLGVLTYSEPMIDIYSSKKEHNELILEMSEEIIQRMRENKVPYRIHFIRDLEKRKVISIR